MKPREPNLADHYQRPYGMPRQVPTEPVHALDRAPAAKPRRQRRGAGSRPNAAVEAKYRERLDLLVLSMHTSVLYWMTAAYRQHEPVMAQDGDSNGLVELDNSGRIGFRSRVGNLLSTDGEMDAAVITLLKIARRLDRMGYSLGLRDVRIVPDRSKWHSYYDFGRDRIVTEGKFWRAPAAERLHMMLHEIGHRGQDADRSGYEKFKRLHENNLSSFEAMANPAHLRDERDGHLHDIAEEVWAESYARWCLGLPMPAELKEFWDARDSRGHAADNFRNGGLDSGLDGGDAVDRMPESADPSYGMDARPPAAFLKAAFARLRKRWEERFDDAASKLARWFAQSAATRSDERLRRILKDGGLSVKFTPTKAMRDVMEGTVQANVALIKSIPSQYLTQVEGAVMRSVQTGRDLHQLSNELRHELGVTKKRAAFIALDQNNKANAAMTRARQIELGIKQAIWVHSHAGREPRPTHLANDGQPYDVERGWFDPDPKVRKRIFPGTLPRCRCFSRPIIEGFKP